MGVVLLTIHTQVESSFCRSLEAATGCSKPRHEVALASTGVTSSLMECESCQSVDGP